MQSRTRHRQIQKEITFLLETMLLILDGLRFICKINLPESLADRRQGAVSGSFDYVTASREVPSAVPEQR